jgi:hypothetical protein
LINNAYPQKKKFVNTVEYAYKDMLWTSNLIREVEVLTRKPAHKTPLSWTHLMERVSNVTRDYFCFASKKSRKGHVLRPTRSRMIEGLRSESSVVSSATQYRLAGGLSNDSILED